MCPIGESRTRSSQMISRGPEYPVRTCFDVQDIRLPEFRAGTPVKGHHGAAVIEADHSAVGGQCHRRDGHLPLPEEFSAFGLYRLDHARALVAIPLPHRARAVPLFPAVGVLLVVVARFPVGVDGGEDDSVGDDQLEGRGGVVVRANDFARGRVQAQEVLPDAWGDVDPVFHGHQSPGHPAGSALQRIEGVEPVAQGPFPEHGAVEGVARRQDELRRQLDRFGRSLVHHVEDPAAGRDHGLHAGRVFVAPGPERSARPSHALRMSGEPIVRRRTCPGSRRGSGSNRRSSPATA